ncbi:MAG: electron transfer flavoprotein subunit beta/FixA family protein, partial [Vulcanimicrobiaceae bacterium]
VILSDPKLENSDVSVTAYVLAAGLKKIGFDLVVCGTQSTDAITGEVPGMLAEHLGVPGLTYVRKLESEGNTIKGQRETDTGYLEISVPTPSVVSVTKAIAEPRYPSLKGIMGAKKKTIAVLSLADLGIDRAVGSDGAKTEVLDLATPPARQKGRVVNAADGPEGATAIFDFLREKKFL